MATTPLTEGDGGDRSKGKTKDGDDAEKKPKKKGKKQQKKADLEELKQELEVVSIGIQQSWRSAIFFELTIFLFLSQDWHKITQQELLCRLETNLETVC